MEIDTAKLRATIKDPQHFKRFSDTLQVFKMRQDLMDLCFVCARGHKVYAHKLLLISVSPQMKKMLMTVPECIDIITIHVPDIEAHILKLMFQFLYEGKLRLDVADHEEFNDVKTLLGIHLINQEVTTNQQQQQQRVQPQVFYYVQTTGPNNQGQVQYLLAAPAAMAQNQLMQVAQSASTGQMIQAAAPGQMMQVTQTPSGQMMQIPQSAAPGQMIQAAVPGQMMQVTQTPSGQMMQVTQAAAPGQMMKVTQAPSGQMMQVAQAQDQVVQVATPNTSMSQGQMVQMAPAIMNQAGQRVQGGTQVSTSMQQSNMVQMAPQNNNQMMPMVAGNQMVQCSNQMVAQASQQNMLNNNQMRSNQNQATPLQRRQTYVTAATTNRMRQYNQPQIMPQQRIAARSRTQANQPVRNNPATSVGGSTDSQGILNILEESNFSLETIQTMSGRQLREILEAKLGIDLSDKEDHIEAVLKSFRDSGDKEVSETITGNISGNEEVCETITGILSGNEEENEVGIGGGIEGEREIVTAINVAQPRSLKAKVPRPAPACVKKRRKKRTDLSDDEDDQDFDPLNTPKKSKRK